MLPALKQHSQKRSLRMAPVVKAQHFHSLPVGRWAILPLLVAENISLDYNGPVWPRPLILLSQGLGANNFQTPDKTSVINTLKNYLAVSVYAKHTHTHTLSMRLLGTFVSFWGCVCVLMDYFCWVYYQSGDATIFHCYSWLYTKQNSVYRSQKCARVFREAFFRVA